MIWPELNALRRQMGAQPRDFVLKIDPNRLTEAELERILRGGIDVRADEVRVLSDGTLAYKDSRVLVYIRDISKDKRAEGAWRLPKFHLANCDTLQQMRRNNRYDRYVVAARDDGYFEVNFLENNRAVKSSPERLHVCQNCLALLAFDGFHMGQPREVRRDQVAAFKLTQFFERYPRALLLDRPQHLSDSAPLNVYSNDFDALSRRIKIERGWKCAGRNCGVVLADRALRRFLHVHHLNGQKHDNRLENLILLCVVCHARQPYHSHMASHPDVDAFRPIRDRLLR